MLKILVLGVLISGCEIHRLDIQQGNIISKDMVQKLKIGMEKSHVKFVLGTPLVTNPFNPDRWDYVYSLRKKNGNYDKKRLTLIFNNDKLARMEGDMANAKALAK